MKIKLFLVLALALLSPQIEAQSFFKKLGKTVEKTVKREVEKLTRDQGNNSSESQQSTQSAQSSSSAQRTTASQASAIQDMGENIEREAGLDYIDEYGINHGGGILIGSVLWAPVNCGYHKTDYPYGKLYQWGRKHGQGYGTPYRDPKEEVRPDKTTAEIGQSWVTPAEARKHPNRFYAHTKGGYFNWTQNDMKLWNNFTDDGKIYKNKVNDPCPEGWRLPDLHDFYSLVEHYSDEVAYYDGGQKGRWFSGPKPYGTNVPRIFLPMSGYRSMDEGKSGARDREGHYWSNRHGGGEGLVWHLYYRKAEVSVNPTAWPHDAYSVRCVKDVPGQQMR